MISAGLRHGGRNIRNTQLKAWLKPEGMRFKVPMRLPGEEFMTICLTQAKGRVKLVVICVLLLAYVSAWAKPAEQDNDRKIVRIHTGIIEGFTMDKVYIDGLGHKLAGDIEFYSPQGEKIPQDRFRRGCKVKFVLSQGKEIVMMQMERKP